MLFWKCGRKQNRCKFVLKTCGNCLIKRQQHVSLYAGEVWWVVEGTHHSCIRIWGEVISYKTGSFVGIVLQCLLFAVSCFVIFYGLLLWFCYCLRSLIVLFLFTVSCWFAVVYRLMLFFMFYCNYVIVAIALVLLLILSLLCHLSLIVSWLYVRLI